MPSGMGICGNCALFMSNRTSAREAPCIASRFEHDGVFLYREVKYSTKTGTKPWCPYGRKKK